MIFRSPSILVFFLAGCFLFLLTSCRSSDDEAKRESEASSLYDEAFQVEKASGFAKAKIIYREVVLRYPDSTKGKLAQKKLDEASRIQGEQGIGNALKAEGQSLTSGATKAQSPPEKVDFVGRWMNRDETLILQILEDGKIERRSATKMESGTWERTSPAALAVSFSGGDSSLQLVGKNEGITFLDESSLVNQTYTRRSEDYLFLAEVAHQTFLKNSFQVSGRTFVAPGRFGLMELRAPRLVGEREKKVTQAELLNGVTRRKSYMLETSAFRVEENGRWSSWMAAAKGASFKNLVTQGLSPTWTDVKVSLEVEVTGTGGSQQTRFKWVQSIPYRKASEVYLTDYALDPPSHVQAVDSGKKRSSKELLDSTVRLIRGRWQNSQGKAWELAITHSSFLAVVQEAGGTMTHAEWNCGSQRSDGAPFITISVDGGNKIFYIVRGISDNHLACSVKAGGFAGLLGAGSPQAGSVNVRMERRPPQIFLPKNKIQSQETEIQDSSQKDQNNGPDTSFYGDEKSVRAFVRRYYEGGSSGSNVQQLEMLGENVRWFGKEKSRTQIKDILLSYREKWPARNYVVSEIRFPRLVTGQAGEAEALVEFTYCLEHEPAGEITAGKIRGRLKMMWFKRGVPFITHVSTSQSYSLTDEEKSALISKIRPQMSDGYSPE